MGLTMYKGGVDPLQVVSLWVHQEQLVGDDGHGEQQHGTTRHGQRECTDPQPRDTSIILLYNKKYTLQSCLRS